MGNRFASLNTFCVQDDLFDHEDWDPAMELENGTKQTDSKPSLTSYLARRMPRLVRNDWVTNALHRCRESIANTFRNAAQNMTKPSQAETITICDSGEEWMEDVFDEFNIVFEPNVSFALPTPAFIVPRNTVVVNLENKRYIPTIKKSTRNEHDDCASDTTDATDSLSEDESKFSDYSSEEEGDNQTLDKIFIDPIDSDDEDCESKVAKLLRLASSCSGIHIALDDYLCQCGECPQYKVIEDDVNNHLSDAATMVKSSVIRILQAFSTYNEVIGYQRNMIEEALECLEVWSLDEYQAFQSFVVLYDEVPRLCGTF